MSSANRDDQTTIGQGSQGVSSQASTASHNLGTSDSGATTSSTGSSSAKDSFGTTTDTNSGGLQNKEQDTGKSNDKSAGSAS
jgi:hypothetical protein